MSAIGHRWPEARLLLLALPPELLWEIAQLPFYDVWRQDDWGYGLYALAHCTLGDLMILMAAYGFVALLGWNRHWFSGNLLPSGILFTLAGLGYTILSETLNAGLQGGWNYAESMPIVPGLGIGALPLLQWIVIPPMLLWLMRRP